ncbi:MAG: hypothetical protein HY565_03790 [Candidatus Kerfeldbacteria bacterium]|nr:hypothetical protein [Candidatus Kerfeldbacteria bacterium]
METKWIDQLIVWLNHNYGYIALGVVGIITVVMANFFIWPQYQRMESGGTLQYRNITTVIEQRQAYITDLQTMQQAYEQLDQRIVRAIDVALPKDYSAGPVFAEVEQLFQGSGFSVQSVNVAATSSTTEAVTAEQPTLYDIVSISVNLSSTSDVTYADFKQLLARIEGYPHLMNLESLTYAPGTGSYTFVLKTYQRKAL